MTFPLPLPFDIIDEKVQDRVNKVPQECPICHKQVIMELCYSNNISPFDMGKEVSYTLTGNCFNCRIEWELTIRQR